jgi:hypothetical protein
VVAKRLSSLLLALCIVVIFVSPAVDLPKTALRSVQASERLLLGMAINTALMWAVVGEVKTMLWYTGTAFAFFKAQPLLPDARDAFHLNCALRC